MARGFRMIASWYIHTLMRGRKVHVWKIEIMNGRLIVSEDEDDENGSGKTKGAPRGRPNHWWAENKDDPHEPDTFSGSFRGVRPVPHGGSSTVDLDDIQGAADLCWCGQPLNHDWPGKALGLKHPRDPEGTQMSQSQDSVQRGMLAGHNPELITAIMQAVNEDGFTYRITRRAVTLYPPDGSNPYVIYPRPNTRAIKRTKIWISQHSKAQKGKAQDTGEPAEVTEEMVEQLADKLNSPEHPVPEPKQDTKAESTTEVKEVPAAAPKEPEMAEPAEGEWRPYITDRTGLVNPLYETNGTLIRCIPCMGTPTEYIRDNARGIGGHTRTVHSPNKESMWTPEAREKATDSRRYNHLQTQVVATIELLAEAAGVELGMDTERVKELEAQVTKLTTENAELTEQLAEQERKLSVLRETLRGL